MSSECRIPDEDAHVLKKILFHVLKKCESSLGYWLTASWICSIPSCGSPIQGVKLGILQIQGAVSQ